MKTINETTERNIFIAVGLHFLFSFGFWVAFLYMNEKLQEHTLWIDIVGWVSYLIVGSFMKVSDRNFHNILSASCVTIAGFLYWLLLFFGYVQGMNGEEGISTVGPGMIWILYLPYVHGSYFILNQHNITNNGYLFGLVLLLINISITFYLYLILKFKQRMRS